MILWRMRGGDGVWDFRERFLPAKMWQQSPEQWADIGPILADRISRIEEVEEKSGVAFWLTATGFYGGKWWCGQAVRATYGRCWLQEGTRGSCEGAHKQGGWVACFMFGLFFLFYFNFCHL